MKHFRFLRESEKWSLEQLKSYQQEKLFSFLEYAGKNSPYYRELFSKIGWSKDLPFSWELFQKIPVVDKALLAKENSNVHSAAITEKLFHCETSGTSGQVLSFQRNESWDSFNRATIMRGYSWHGVDPWEYNLYFWGFNFSLVKKIKVRFFDFLVNRYRLFDYSEKNITRMIHKLPHVVYIEGYASMIYELARLVAEKNVPAPKLKMVKGTSEKIHPHYQEISMKAFGKRMISEYGSGESGIIAFECAAGSMHLNMEGVYVETDEQDEIIVTNFMSHSFPVIRYRLGDTIKMRDEQFKCPCGMQHPVVEEIIGRVGKVIIGKSGKYPSMTFYSIIKNLYFNQGLQFNYQVHQHKPGFLEFRIKELCSPEEVALITAEAAKYFGNDMEVHVIPGSELRIHNGKMRDFISTIGDDHLTDKQ